MSIEEFSDYVADRWERDPLGQAKLHPVPFSPIAVMGLAGEVGEVIELLKKHQRDGVPPGNALKLELGDVLHYITHIAGVYGWTLSDLAAANRDKLAARDAAARNAAEKRAK